MRKLFLVFAGLAAALFGLGQPGHHIQIEIDGYEEDSLRLAYYLGAKQYIKEVAGRDPNGLFVFQGEEALEPGIYLAATMGGLYFELVLDAKDQHFKASTSYDDMSRVKIVGSEENEAFYWRIHKNSDLQYEYQKLQQENEAGASEKVIAKNKARMVEIQKEITTVNETFLDKFPNTFTAKILRMNQAPEVPEQAPEGVTDVELWRFQYYRDRFWDNTDFMLQGISRTPVFHQKLITFIDQLTYQHPDSVTKWACWIIDKTLENDELFRYTLVTLLNKYASSKIIGFDGVYADLVDRYYATGKAYWSDEESLTKMRDRSTKINATRLGHIPMNFSLKDVGGIDRNLFKSVPQGLTILMFLDPDCGHCKKISRNLTAMLDSAALKHQDQVTFFRVWKCVEETAEQKEKIEKLVIENPLKGFNVLNAALEYEKIADAYDIRSYPVLYVLDENKQIISKRFGLESLRPILNGYLDSTNE